MYRDDWMLRIKSYMSERRFEHTKGVTDVATTFLLRIRFQGVATQHDLVELFKVSGAYIAKLLRKFEDNGYIARKEDPENRRKKLVKLTDDGIKKTDELIEVIQNWEDKVTAGISEDEIKTLKEILFKITMI